MEAVNFIDMIGKKFGRLLVVSRDRNNKDGRTRWKCAGDTVVNVDNGSSIIRY